MWSVSNESDQFSDICASCCFSGQSGLGKSTLINTLFKSKISRKSVQPTSEERIPKTIEIKSITHGKSLARDDGNVLLGERESSERWESRLSQPFPLSGSLKNKFLKHFKVSVHHAKGSMYEGFFPSTVLFLNFFLYLLIQILRKKVSVWNWQSLIPQVLETTSTMRTGEWDYEREKAVKGRGAQRSVCWRGCGRKAE